MNEQAAPPLQKKLGKRILFIALAAICLLIAKPIIGTFAESTDASGEDTSSKVYSAEEDINLNLNITYYDSTGAEQTKTEDVTLSCIESGTYTQKIEYELSEYIMSESATEVEYFGYHYCYAPSLELLELNDFAKEYTVDGVTYTFMKWEYSDLFGMTIYADNFDDIVFDRWYSDEDLYSNEITINAIYTSKTAPEEKLTIGFAYEDTSGNVIEDIPDNFPTEVSLDAVYAADIDEYVYITNPWVYVTDWYSFETEGGSVYVFYDLEYNRDDFSDDLDEWYITTDTAANSSYKVTEKLIYRQNANARVRFLLGDESVFSENLICDSNKSVTIELLAYDSNIFDNYTTDEIVSWDIYVLNKSKEEVFVGSYGAGETVTLDLSGYEYTMGVVGEYYIRAYANGKTATSTTTTTTTAADSTTTTTTTAASDSGDISIIADGTDVSYTIGSGKTASIHCSGELSNFQGVYMDGTSVDASNYTLTEGSTIVTFTNAYLDTLSVGKHTITLVFSDGSVSTTLTVAAATGSSSPGTGDDFDATPFIALMILSGTTAIISAALAYRKRKLAFEAE